MTNERDERGRDEAKPGVLGGTPAEQRHGEGRTGEGVYSGTPEEERPRNPGAGDHGPLGWADVPGRPRPDMGGDAGDR